MVAEPIVQEPVTADPEPTPEPQTEEPTPQQEPEPAAEPEAAAAPQMEIAPEPEKPEYMTKADWEREKAEVASRAAADALEADRRRRQTENARKAKADADEREAAQETADVIRASLVSQGIDPSILADEAVTRTIDRVARKRADRIASRSLDTVDEAWDYLTAPAYGKSVEPDDGFADAANRLGPKLQHFVDTIRPAIEAKAVEEFRKNGLAKAVDDEIARRAAASRKGQEDLTRVDGKPAPTTDRSHEAIMARTAKGLGDEQDNKYAAEYIDRIRRR